MQISINQLSELTGSTYRTIKKRLVGLDPVGRGPSRAYVYDSAAALRRIYGADLEARQGDDEGANYSALLDYERYREKKRENDIEEKKVAPVSLLTEALLKAGNIIIPILESLPLLMKRHFPELTGDQIQLVKTATAECRNAIADMEINLDD